MVADGRLHGVPFQWKALAPCERAPFDCPWPECRPEPLYLGRNVSLHHVRARAIELHVQYRQSDALIQQTPHRPSAASHSDAIGSRCVVTVIPVEQVAGLVIGAETLQQELQESYGPWR